MATARADDVRITLSKAFIDKLKDVATITEDCLHIAARCSESQLPAVIEIKNARKEPGAVHFAQQSAAGHEALSIDTQAAVKLALMFVNFQDTEESKRDYANTIDVTFNLSRGSTPTLLQSLSTQ
jgi:hypothetical protein